jgi:hypothetical protein
MAWQNTSSFPLCPDHRPGPTLMSARTGLSGGYRATGIPTAITHLATERARLVTLHLKAGALELYPNLAVPRKPGNSGGGKGPQLKTSIPMSCVASSVR